MATLPLPPHRSLLHGVEQLPPYTPRRTPMNDPETASIHSDAPSYVSAAPSYHSYLPASHRRASDVLTGTPSPVENQQQHQPRLDSQQRQERQTARTQPTHNNNSNRHGLPPTPMYARGFENRIGPISPFSNSSNFTARSIRNTASSLRSIYNSSEWVPVTSGLQSRHYRNVANRRVTSSSSEINAISRFIFPGLFQTTTDLTSSSTSETENRPSSSRNTAVPSSLGQAHNSSTITLVRSPTEEPPSVSTAYETASPMHSGIHLPLSPHEDPDLVGEEAAARFRSQRLYMASQQDELNRVRYPTPPRSPAQQQDPPSQPGLVYQYSSLVSPASTSIEFTPSPEQQRRARMTGSPVSSDNLLLRPRPSRDRIEAARSQSPETQQLNIHPLTPTPTQTPAAAPNTAATLSAEAGPGPSTTARYNRRSVVDHDSVLRAQEAQNWDFMLAQMADGEGRERSWKKRYKGQVEKQIHIARHLKLGPLLMVGWRRRLEERKKAKARAFN
ncbi:hypothetical protein TMEN_5109 [Trichophyton mentagrophytes]|uniref:Uncharacterized protein n=1 Tax=Trichophyton interdigitale (strain MR816) TaxID=1215338 RepID=A0A059J4F8_TRIIM|nr:hypothetical protein H101_06758 [Trichophyton interdigitale H6]KDB22751.1 hypothetical protein H109_05346 [Trichophyton interdigitale MR816]GBF62562.1 hypothetical protein TMEN_5109 [Trichophyton mentagrophytes]